MKIQLKKNYIEIPLVDEEGKTLLTYRFEKSDESIQKFAKDYEKLKKQSETIGENSKDNIDFIRKVFDSTLGEGMFDKTYELNPSVIIVLAYYLEICNYIANELVETRKSLLIDKYTKG